MKRDLYDLERGIQRFLKTMSDWAKPEDRAGIQKMYVDCVLQDLSLARQHIYLYRLKLLSRITGKPVSSFTPNDVRKLVFRLKKDSTAPATIKLYLDAIRKFFKCSGKKAPIKNIRIHIPVCYPKQLLEEEDIHKLTLAAINSRDKAFVQCEWETGGRVGETMNCRVEDVDFLNCCIYLDGKTGQRVIPVLSCLPFLKRYIQARGLTNGMFLWCQINGSLLKYDALRMQLKKIARRAGVEKPVNSHHFRHSRVTFCARFMNEAQLRSYFGWTMKSKVASRYIHLSTKDLQNSIRVMNGFKPLQSSTSILAPRECICGELNTYQDVFCKVCNTGLKV